MFKTNINDKKRQINECFTNTSHFCDFQAVTDSLVSFWCCSDINNLASFWCCGVIYELMSTYEISACNEIWERFHRCDTMLLSILFFFQIIVVLKVRLHVPSSSLSLSPSPSPSPSYFIILSMETGRFLAECVRNPFCKKTVCLHSHNDNNLTVTETVRVNGS